MVESPDDARAQPRSCSRNIWGAVPKISRPGGAKREGSLADFFILD
jgi:hypothetical protein